MGSNFNVQEFINRFDDMIDYDIEVIVGGKLANHYKIDPKHISDENYKGKMYPVYYKNSENDNTTYLTYKPAEKLSLPIQVLVRIKPEYIVEIENSKIYERTNSEITIFNSCGYWAGDASIGLNKAGDIESLNCHYDSYTGRHEISHQTIFLANSHQKKEYIEYIERYLDFGSETTVNIYKIADVITCITIHNRKTETKDESMSEIVKNLLSQNGMLFMSRCMFDPNITDPIDGNIIFNCSYESHKINSDINRIVSDCVGNYIGHTYVQYNDYSTLCINTTKDGYNLYTLIDLTGTFPFQGPIAIDYDDFDEGLIDSLPKRDEEYLRRIKYADKTPLFITKKNEDGKESLVGYKGILFNEYDAVRGANVKDILEKSIQNKNQNNKQLQDLFDLVYKLRDLHLTSEDKSTIIDNLEEIASKEFESFAEKFIFPFTEIEKEKPKQKQKK